MNRRAGGQAPADAGAHVGGQRCRGLNFPGLLEGLVGPGLLVLGPPGDLAELAPELPHPLTRRSIREMLAATASQ